MNRRSFHEIRVSRPITDSWVETPRLRIHIGLEGVRRESGNCTAPGWGSPPTSPGAPAFDESATPRASCHHSPRPSRAREDAIEGVDRAALGFTSDTTMSAPETMPPKKGSDAELAIELKVHEKHIDAIIADFETDPDKGITQAEADARLLIYGTNELEKPPRISLFMLFIIQLNSVIMYLLMGAVLASAAIKASGPNSGDPLNYIDAIAIFIIVLINATIAAVTENNANDALEARGPQGGSPFFRGSPLGASEVLGLFKSQESRTCWGSGVRACRPVPVYTRMLSLPQSGTTRAVSGTNGLTVDLNFFLGV